VHTTPQYTYFDNPYDEYLYIGTTYLFGIGGGCSRIKMWTPYSNFSHDLIQAIDDGCRECHVVSVQFQNYFSFSSVNESGSSVSFELLLSNPVSVDITVQVGVVNPSSATG